MTERLRASGSSPLLVSREGHVGTITLNRPDRLNALNRELFEGLADAWRSLDADPKIRVIIVTGEGKGFCAGADMVAPSVTNRDQQTAERAHVPLPLFTARQMGVFKPVITAVNGVCASAGLHFVVDSDIVIASENATFVDTHVNVGQISALEPIGLARKMPLESVLRMVALGRAERMTAARALQLGMISEVVPADELGARARELAEHVAEASPTTLQRSLRAIWESLNLGIDEALDRGWHAVQDHYGHPDNVEGPLAFAEKRSPNWVDPLATDASPDQSPKEGSKL
ncbi:enoyl-CoA hydratase/isomerase family protein [Aeromicrobium panaciterrae]|uniref:enoyl-CoA hydratase/isomerase family protein n=1 Tax=Aeromicrobium panaciterrae TaxID=363861 RepID=UPI0031CFFCBF